MLFQSIFQVLIFLPFFTFADEVIIRPPSGDVFSIEVNPEDSFSDVMELVGNYVNVIEAEVVVDAHQQFPARTYVLDFAQNNLAYANFKQPAASSGQAVAGGRDYFRQPTPAEKQDIAFIIGTLANGSFLTLLGKRADLQAAGDRINGIHPLRLINYIVSDSELKNGIRAMSTKHMVWKEFSSNICDNLDKEARNNTMNKNVVQDFAKTLKINNSAIVPPWNQFLDFAISQ